MAQATQSQRLTRLSPHWARPTHPVYQREMEKWARSRGARSLRTGCAPLAFVIFAVMGCLCGLTTLDPSVSPQERLLIWSLILLWALLVGQAFVSFATGLIATALSATVISGELESETYSLLRVTDIPTNEIVLAKYAAALRQLIPPVIIIVSARLLLIAGGLATLDYALRLQGGGLFSLLDDIPTELFSPASVGAVALAGLGWLGYFTFKPVLSMMTFASVGLFASSITRTRVNGVITAVGLRVALYVLRFIVDQTIAVGGQLSIGLGANSANLDLLLDTLITTRPALLIALASLLTLGGLVLAIAWRGTVTVLLVRGAVRRAYKLPYE